jgi:hypothetical protein
MAWFMVAGLSPTARAQQVIVTVTGTVASGTDGIPGGASEYPAGTGNVFGGGANLSGPFTLTLILDGSQGDTFLYTCPDGSVYHSDIDIPDVAAGSTGTAVLQIGGGSFSYGVFPSTVGWGINQTAPASCYNGSSSLLFSWGESYTGNYLGDSGFGEALLYPLSDFASGDWRTAVPTVSVAGSAAFMFYIKVFEGGTLTKWATGNLTPETLTIRGPGTACPSTTSYSNIGPNSVLAASGPTCPTQPRILRDGIDITEIPQAVVVGQQISLTASLPTGATLASPQPWNCLIGSTTASCFPGTTVGGFVVSPDPNHPMMGQTNPTDFTGASTTFYWVDPSPVGGSFTITLSCTLSNGQNTTVQTNFTVSGPTMPNVVPTFGTVMILNNKLSFGNPVAPNPPGIRFTASAIPSPNSAGVFQWVQLIQEDTVTELLTIGEVICRAVSGGELDGSYPYPNETINTTKDTPDLPLVAPPAGFISLQRTFAATMYLMWQSTPPSSIRVPLGSINWTFTAVANISPSTHTWAVSPTSSWSANAFNPSVDYPNWTRWNPIPPNNLPPTCEARRRPL